MDRLRTRSVEYLPTSFEMGRLASGEIVTGDLDNDPDINIYDNDLARRAGYSKADLAKEALGSIDIEAQGYDYNGQYIVRTYQFHTFIGVGGCVEVENEKEIIKGIRSGKAKRKHPTRWVVAQEGSPTRQINFILQRQPNSPQEVSVVAAYMGLRAMPEPVGRYATDGRCKRFWQNRALVLYNPKQIDTTSGEAMPRTSEGREMSRAQLEDLFEEKKQKFLVEKTIEHMRDGEFGPRYVQMAREQQAKTLIKLDEAAGKWAERVAEKGIETYASLCLMKQLYSSEPVFKYWQLVLPEGAKTIKLRGWGKLMRYARREASSELSDGRPLKKYLSKAYLPRVKDSRQYTEALSSLQKKVDVTGEKATQEINVLLKELTARKGDPIFVDAACSWTSAPDSDGNIGPSGQAFSGGLVHFFEYRSGIAKRERFKTIKEPMTVDGFIRFTARLKKEVSAAERLLNNHITGKVEGEASENYITVLCDEEGNKRFYILKPNNDLILGYQKPNQAIKLSTMITDSSIEYVNKVVEESIRGEDRGRINKLGPKVRCLMRQYPAEIETEAAA